MSFQLILEIIRTFFIAVLLYNVIRNKIRTVSSADNNGWRMILFGISFVLLGSILDTTKNFEFLNRFIIIGDTEYSNIFKTIFGYLPGIGLTAFGFGMWIPKVRENQKKSNELQIDNYKINEIKQQLDTILRSIGEAVIAVDSDKKIIHINPEAERITCWNKEDALGKSLGDVYKSKNEISLNADNLIDSLLSDYAINNEQERIEIEDKNGGKHLISATITPMTENNELNGMVLIFREMEFVETVEKRLMQKKKMESLSIFANGVAHDFNNQLTGVQGFCELLEVEVTDREQLDYISEIRKAVDRSVELTDRLLAFARKEEPKSDKINIGLELKELVGAFSQSSTKINLKAPKEDLLILGNRNRIVSSFRDILNNSLDATVKGGEISISIYRELLDEEFLKVYPYAIPVGEYVRVVINDTGIGMNPDTLDKVFEPFFTTEKRSYGKGMGLASVYGVVSRHDGLISITSKLTKGTEVNLYLPLLVDSVSENINEVYSNEKSILIVDDEEFIRFYIKKELGRRGFLCKVFEDGESALKYFERHKDEFSVAVIDYVMPKINGLELIRKLTKLNKDLGFVLMSGKVPDKELEDSMDECKRCTFLSKPFDGPTLLNALKKYFENA